MGSDLLLCRTSQTHADGKERLRGSWYRAAAATSARERAHHTHAAFPSPSNWVSAGQEMLLATCPLPAARQVCTKASWLAMREMGRNGKGESHTEG